MIRILTPLVYVCVLASGLMAQRGSEWFRGGVWDGPGDAIARPAIKPLPGDKTDLTEIQPEAFTAGNIVVCRIGTGTSSLSSASTPVFLDEFTPNGVYVSTVALPTAISGANYPLTLSGTNATECQITRSTDGRYLIVAGYPQLPGVSGVSTVVGNRIFARVDAGGSVNTTTMTDTLWTNVVRSAASVDGTGIWAVGSAGGVHHIPFGVAGTATIVSSTVADNRTVNIYGNQLYTSSRSGSYRIGSVGSGTPSSSSNTMSQITGYPTNDMPGAFFMVDLDTGVPGVDTLYVADEGTGTGQAGGGVKKFALVGGVWTYKGTFPASSSPSIPATTFMGLTGSVTAPNTVTLFATRLTSPGNQLVKFVDSTGYNAAPTAAPTLLSTAAANTVYRGVALAPETPATAPSVATGTASNLAADSATLNGTANPSGASSTGYFRFSTTDPGTCNDSFGTRAPSIGGTDLGSGGASVAYSQNITGLTSGTTYYYCAIAQNSVGTSYGSVSSFTTLLPSISVNDVSQSEGDAGVADFTFTVSLSAPAGPGGVSFDIATANGAAESGSDYTANALSGQTIPQGGTSLEFVVKVSGDSYVEPNESFYVNLTNVTGATLGSAQGIGTISNDDTYGLNLVVTKTADTNDGFCNDDCSLREAIAAANSLPDANTVTFVTTDPNAIAAEAVTLSSELRITSDLNITGPGADQMTINGGSGSSRIFDVASGTTVMIANLTLAGGGGVGTFNSGNGGAIRAEGALTLEGVHLSSNSVSVSGGGLYLVGAGPYLISNSTFSGNYAAGSGAGLYKNSAADVTIVNTTFSGNSIAAGNAGAALCTLGLGTTTLRGVTIYGNSAPSFAAGIYHATGTLDIGNSIIAGNISASFPELYIASGTVSSSGFNIIGDSTGDAASTNLAISYKATDKNDVDPKLAPLADNGGPVPTHAFDNSSGLSPAIDAGNSFDLTVDARGLSRTVDLASVANAVGGDGTDIGAYELLAPSAASVRITGRVLTSYGRPIAGAVVSLSGESGSELRAVTNMFGYYRLEGVSGGEGYVLLVAARRYSFRAVFVNADADVAGLDVYAER